MITLNNFSFEFGGRVLYEEASWHIKPNERIGLVGLNGTGKSTLLRIITGEYQIADGTFSKRKDVTIGFLNQDLLSYQSTESIYHVALQAFEGALKLQMEMDDLIQKIEIDPSEKNLMLLGEKQEQFEALDGYNIQYKTEEILEGLGFSTADLQRPLKEFSGGWRMRVMLAKLLLQQPSLLMLDEPTNHLDLPSIEWLENYLQSYQGTVIIVSHDRYFLDRMVTKIVEVTNRRLYHFSGNYTFFLEAKKERDELQQRQFENQQQYIKQQERFIERFKAKASKATQAQSRVKMLEKLDRVEEVVNDDASMNLKFKVKQHSGKVLVSLEDIGKVYGSQIIFDHANGKVLRGDKIALIGANGKGKSTLLRILDGSEPVTGKVEHGYNVIKSFYAQHQLESLNVNNEILEELKQQGTDKLETELRTVLGCFLFTGEEVFKKIKVLSGGEKARVALAKTLIQESNFLLLDEPTNHLDMQSINILIKALQGFEGTFVTVSHDRYFIREVANKIWWIENGLLKEYPGTYDEFKYWFENVRKEEVTIPVKKQETKGKAVVVQDDGANESKKMLKKLKLKLEEKEATLEVLRKQKLDLEQKLSIPDIVHDSEKFIPLKEEYKNFELVFKQANDEFEAIFEEILSLEQNNLQ